MTGPTDYMAALRSIEPLAEAACRNAVVNGQNVRASTYHYECIYRTDDLPMPDRATLEAAWAAIEPDHVWTTDEFFDRFTPPEIVAIAAAATTDADVSFLKEKLLSRRQVRRNSPELQAAMTALVSKGLLTDTRRTEILTP